MTTRLGHEGHLAVLSAYDCWHLLEAAEVARIAWPGSDGVAIVPMNYTVNDGALWIRANPDSALGRECSGQRVAVEVDLTHPVRHAAWSVVVVGTVELVTAANVSDALIDMPVWPAGSR